MTLAPKRLLQSLLLATIAMLLALAVAELGAELLMPGWAPTHADRTFLIYDSLLGWALEPGDTGTFSHPDFKVHVAINALGMRGRAYPIERTPGHPRMLLLGDSFGWGFGVEDSQSFSSLMQRRHPEWELLNGSVTGYGTDQEYLYLRYRAERLRPDVVLLLFHPNDVYDNNSVLSYWHNKPRAVLQADTLAFEDVPVAPLSLRQRVRIATLGHTYLLPRLASGAIAMRRWFGTHLSVAYPTLEAVDYTLTHRLLLGIAEESRRINARLVVCSVPTHDERLKLFLRRTASEAGFAYLPLDSAFTTVTDSVHFAHDEHWNARGHAVATEAIDRFMGTEGIWVSREEGRRH